MKYDLAVFFIRKPSDCRHRDDTDRYPFGNITNKCLKTGEVCDARDKGIIPDWCPLKDVPLKEDEE